MQRLFTLVLVGTVFFVLSSCAHRALPVHIQVLAINDFHGTLMAPGGGMSIFNPDGSGDLINLPAGGAEHMASLVHDLRAANPNTIMVAAGDLIGASPLTSSLFHDEPTIESLSLMGLEVSAVGNHEFDEGRDELLRIQNGGCHPLDGCKGPEAFAGATFQYLAANVIDTDTGNPILPSTYLKTFGGIKIAFIGLTLEDTAANVVPSGVRGLAFRDEAETINALVPELRAEGIEAIFVLIHEGGVTTGGYNECIDISGPIVDITMQLDPAVDAVITGHTHQAYNCVIDGRLVTSAGSSGTLLTRLDLILDPITRDVASAVAQNLIVDQVSTAKDASQTELLASYEALVAPLANRVAGSVTAPIGRDQNLAGEMPLGSIIADAQLAATAAAENGAADIAFTNPGGIRTDITRQAGEDVTYADLFAVQPFNNNLVTLSLSGAQIREILEQQWADPDNPVFLQISEGFSYAWDGSRPVGDRVLMDSMSLNGAPIMLEMHYRVTVNGFLAQGGDGFTVLREGVEQQIGMVDSDALEAYFRANSPIAPPMQNRIQRVN